MNATDTRPRLGLVQIGVIILALVTAFIHFHLFYIEGFLSGETLMAPIYQLLFVLNFLGYVTLAVVLYLPISLLERFRPVLRVLLIALATASIISYFHVNVRDFVGDIDKIIEILLVMLLAVDAGMSSSREELVAGR